MKSKFNKWFKGNFIDVGDNKELTRHGWDAACKSILSTIKRRHKEFEGNWQHEDIDFLMEDIKDMIKK